jgi:flagellar biosynthesis protein FlhF
MNVKRFSARSSREALNLVRQAFGDDAVVLSTRPCAEGVEVLAMAPEGVAQMERAASEAAPAALATPPRLPPLRRPVLPSALSRAVQPDAAPSTVEQDVAKLSMSTLSFQDYVRERMLRRRRAEQQALEQSSAAEAQVQAAAAEREARPAPPAAQALRARADAGRTEPVPPTPPCRSACRPCRRRRRPPQRRIEARCSTSCAR